MIAQNQGIIEFQYIIVTICNNFSKKPKVLKKNADIHDVKKRT